MNRKCQIALAISIAFLGFSWQIFGGSHVQICLYILGIISSMIFGFCAYFAVRMHLSPKFEKNYSMPVSVLKMQEQLCEKYYRKEFESADDTKSAPVISRNIDETLNNLIELVSRDYILIWFGYLMHSDQETKKDLKKDFWVIIRKLSERLSNTDHVKLLAMDVIKKITDHFERIRLAQDSPDAKFEISPHLISSEREMEYLSKVTEALVILLFPEDYAHCIPVRHFIKELLARIIFAPTIDKITDPAYINSKILGYIKKHQVKLKIIQCKL